MFTWQGGQGFLLYTQKDQKLRAAARELLADFGAGAVEIPADSRFGHIHDIRDIVDFAPLDIA